MVFKALFGSIVGCERSISDVGKRGVSQCNNLLLVNVLSY